MTAPTIRDEVIGAWIGILTRAGIRPSEAEAYALELEQAAASRGARLPRRPRAEDPNLAGLQWPAPAAVRPAAASSDYQAARAALRAPGAPDSPIPPMPTGGTEESR